MTHPGAYLGWTVAMYGNRPEFVGDTVVRFTGRGRNPQEAYADLKRQVDDHYQAAATLGNQLDHLPCP